MRKAAVYTIRRPEQPVPLQDARKKQTFLAEKVQRVQATYDGYKIFSVKQIKLPLQPSRIRMY